MAGQENQQYTVLYGRLSQEDERAGESNSIQHQRTLLEKYAKEKGFENTIFLADDGYSGTNFERPSWKKIVEMIEAGQVANLIVKDASRLGREYLQVGYYMEIYFPQKNVRFIAVNDGVDSTVESSNDFNPIRNWANELHAKDTSRKIRAVNKAKGERGVPLTVNVPFGYRKDPEDKTKWVVDEAAALVVKRIFKLCMEGRGQMQIAKLLQEEKVLNPTAYKKREGIKTPSPETADPLVASGTAPGASDTCAFCRLPGPESRFKIQLLQIRRRIHIFLSRVLVGPHLLPENISRFKRDGYFFNKFIVI